jgi:hypothetical protein
MWGWLFEQPPAWMEIVIGIALSVSVLFLEDYIDRYRGGKGRMIDE